MPGVWDMRSYDENRHEKLKETLFIAKILTMIISAMIFMGQSNRWRAENDPEITMIALLGLFAVLFVMYEIWIIFNPGKRQMSASRMKNIMEIAIFMVFFNSIIMYSGGHASPHKFLYLFVIITATLQFGMRAGFITATFSTLSLLVVDLMALKGTDVNFYFQNDLVLCSLFFLISWVLSKYMTAEKSIRGELVDIANIDSMTEVYNHRYFQDCLTRFFEDCSSKGQPLSLLFIDVDNFKRVNDLFGHFIGDRVLKDVAQTILKNVREDDVVCRYGGEEFTVLLPERDEEMALVIAERIRYAIESEGIKEDQYKASVHVTVSVGVSVFPDKAKTREELIKKADFALYQAKLNKKNRVEVS